MTYDRAMHSAFADELEKIAISMRHMVKHRSGRRPMKVTTLLRKEKEGTLYKHAQYSEQSSLFYTEDDPKTGKATATKKRKGEVPSREDVEQYPKSHARQDQRLGTDSRPIQMNEAGYVNQPAEHGNF